MERIQTQNWYVDAGVEIKATEQQKVLGWYPNTFLV